GIGISVRAFSFAPRMASFGWEGPLQEPVDRFLWRWERRIGGSNGSMSSELLHTIEQIGREKGIDPEVIIQAVEEAYAAASRKYLRSKEDFGARFDRDSGRFIVFSKQTVVTEDELMDPHTEITLEEARQIRADAELGTVIETVK